MTQTMYCTNPDCVNADGVEVYLLFGDGATPDWLETDECSVCQCALQDEPVDEESDDVE